jgi:predicted AAA+ superfamily ATPase
VKYFQVAYQLDKEDTLQRELTSLEEVQDNREKYVVHFEDIAYSVQKGIKFIKVLELGEVM